MLLKIVGDLRKRDEDRIFHLPVDREQVPDYDSVIDQPMDLRTMEENIRSSQFTCFADVVQAFRQMCINCIRYNGWCVGLGGGSREQEC